MFQEEIQTLRSYFEANKKKKDFIAHQSKVIIPLGVECTVTKNTVWL